MSEQRPPSGALLTRAGDEQLAVSAQAGDDAARETLIMRHRRLVWRVARAFRSAGFPLEDLHQAGTIGLIVAVDRFDPQRGVRFATYARALIQGELQHLLRDHGWAVRVPRSLQELGRAAVDEEVRLTQAGGAPASTADISASLNEDGALVAEALQAWTAYRAVRWFDEADGADSDDPAIRDALSVDDPGFEHAEDRLAIAAALPRLPVRQRRIIALRFWRGMKQKHIASELGMSQMHVSRLLAAALQNLAEAMAR